MSYLRLGWPNRFEQDVRSEQNAQEVFYDGENFFDSSIEQANYQY